VTLAIVESIHKL